LGLLIVFCKLISITLSLVTTCMFLRALLPLFMDVEGKSFFTVLFVITELFVTPVRAVMFKLGVGQNSPLDVPFFVTYLLLVIVQWFLPII